MKLTKYSVINPKGNNMMRIGRADFLVLAELILVDLVGVILVVLILVILLGTSLVDLVDDQEKNDHVKETISK